MATWVGDGDRAHIEAQVGLAFAGIRAVTGETLVGENRPNVLIEADVGVARSAAFAAAAEKGRGA